MNRSLLVLLIVACSCIVSIAAFAAASDRMGTYYLDSVSDNVNGIWANPTLTTGKTYTGTTNVHFTQNAPHVQEFPYNTQERQDKVPGHGGGNSPDIGTLGFALYLDWTRQNQTAQQLMQSSLMPVYAGEFKHYYYDGPDCINSIDLAKWEAAWKLAPLCGISSGVTQAIWVIEALDPGEVWGGNRLIAKNYFGEQDVELMKVFDVTLEGKSCDGGTCPVPEPATMLLLGSGLVSLIGLKRIRK